MRKNVLAKVVTFAVTTVICLSSVCTPILAHAEAATEGIGILRYIAIISCSNNLTLGSAGKLNCQGKTEVQNGYAAEVIVELQRKNGTTWTTIKTWSDYDTAGIAMVTQDWYVESGTYRLQLTHNAKTSAGVLADSVVNYSSEVTY